jgi:hypothetical protein
MRLDIVAPYATSIIRGRLLVPTSCAVLEAQRSWNQQERDATRLIFLCPVRPLEIMRPVSVRRDGAPLGVDSLFAY